MYHFLGRRLIKPEFPVREDLPLLDDLEAAAALAELRTLIYCGLADVYTPVQLPPEPGQRYRWNIWLSHDLVRGGLRLELAEWAERRAEWTME